MSYSATLYHTLFLNPHTHLSLIPFLSLCLISLFAFLSLSLVPLPDVASEDDAHDAASELNEAAVQEAVGTVKVRLGLERERKRERENG